MVISGILKAVHIPLAIDKPMRKPVYDPGPMLTETAFNWDNFIPAFSAASLIKGARIVL